MIPQLLLAAIHVLALGIALANQGRPRDGKWSFGTTVISVSLEAGLLWWGGWFECFFRGVP